MCILTVDTVELFTVIGLRPVCLLVVSQELVSAPRGWALEYHKSSSIPCGRLDLEAGKDMMSPSHVFNFSDILFYHTRVNCALKRLTYFLFPALTPMTDVCRGS